jgi:hypothetical protein
MKCPECNAVMRHDSTEMHVGIPPIWACECGYGEISECLGSRGLDADRDAREMRAHQRRQAVIDKLRPR